MGRIFVTGDTHGSLDIHKLNMSRFPEQKNLTKQDYVIVCGDFGLVWNNGEKELFWRNWLQERNFTALFIDGNHENFDLLKTFPVRTWKGGKVRFINDSIIHLMRGQVYTIHEKKFYTMGGANSIDRKFRTPGISWWAEEIPNKQEIEEGFKNLKEHQCRVDYIITHTAPLDIMEEICYVREYTILNNLFMLYKKHVKFKQWYLGHFHLDGTIGKFTILYNDIVEIKE